MTAGPGKDVRPLGQVRARDRRTREEPVTAGPGMGLWPLGQGGARDRWAREWAREWARDRWVVEALGGRLTIASSSSSSVSSWSCFCCSSYDIATIARIRLTR